MDAKDRKYPNLITGYRVKPLTDYEMHANARVKVNNHLSLPKRLYLESIEKEEKELLD